MQQSTDILVADIMAAPLTTSATNSSQDSTLQAFYKDDIINLASDDIDMLAALAVPEILNLLFPPVFKAIWELMVSSSKVQEDTQLAIGLPRGKKKTTVVKLYILSLV